MTQVAPTEQSRTDAEPRGLQDPILEEMRLQYAVGGRSKIEIGQLWAVLGFLEPWWSKTKPAGKIIFIQRKKICHGAALRQQEDFVTRCAPRGVYNSPSAGTDAAFDPVNM